MNTDNNDSASDLTLWEVILIYIVYALCIFSACIMAGIAYGLWVKG